MRDPSGHVVHYNPGEPDDYDDPQERLMAAASELLEAIKAAKVQRDPRHRISMLVNDWQRILDAISKAEGREP